MQDWRFDNLTRTLGQATSRRQVFKGLLGGLGAALLGRAVGAPGTAAAGCSVQACERSALDQLVYMLSSTCQDLCSPEDFREGGLGACIGCRVTAHSQYRDALRKCWTGDGCLAPKVCCGRACVDTQSDPNNCGACGHACSSGETCNNGQCACGQEQTNCNGQCVDTQSDKHNCGSCGHACGTCEDCVLGQCVHIECADGQTCCNDNCVPLCLNGDLPDPATCQCNICKGQIDGAACDANDSTKACCQEQCVSTQCPSGKSYSFDTCQCQCTSTCPSGQLQDPETCQCQDLCNGVVCDECHTCDPTSGDCVMADVNSSCSAGVCCKGQCMTPCPSGEEYDPSTCQCKSACGSGCQPVNGHALICCSDESSGDSWCCYDTQTCVTPCNGGYCCSGPFPPGCDYLGCNG